MGNCLKNTNALAHIHGTLKKLNASCAHARVQKSRLEYQFFARVENKMQYLAKPKTFYCNTLTCSPQDQIQNLNLEI